MGGQYTRALPTIVFAGSASRDVTAEDPRGWRLGGAVSYGALAAARLGMRTGAIVGVDSVAARAAELDLLRMEGVDVIVVELANGPVFDNRETADGRVQHCLDAGEPLPVGAVPAGWEATKGWVLAPVADELSDSWAGVPGPDAVIGLAWQGLLRTLSSGEVVRRRPPAASPFLERAGIVGVSVDDLDAGTEIDSLTALLGTESTLLLTRGAAGGLAISRLGAASSVRRYPAVRAREAADPTGAGDVFLAAFVAAAIDASLTPGSGGGLGPPLRLAATAASFTVERPGLLGVPGLEMVRRRMNQGRVETRSAARDARSG
jgi:sugar/nucleoside kinase (ribokinase family)